MNYPPYSNDPNDPHSQPTVAGQYSQWGQPEQLPQSPQWPQPGQPSYPQWGQQVPPPPQFPQQPGQYLQSGQNFPQYVQQSPQPGQFGSPPPQPPGQPAVQQPPLKPYSDGVLCILFLLNISFWICAFFGGGVGNFGKSAITGSIVAFCIMDWRGFVSLDGWIKWKQFSGKKKFWLSCLFIFTLPIAFVVYLVRRVNAFSEARKRKMPELPYRKGRPVLAMVIGFFVFIFVLAGSSGNASGEGATIMTIAPTPTQQVAHTAPTQKPAMKPTPTLTPSPTPTPISTPTPSPTLTPTPEPTQPPVQQSQQQPAQQAPAPATGVNNNPWGYDFNPGNYIYSPNSGFCSYFSCINNFWNGNGYVEECSDGMYGKSGGISGSCSHHGGNYRPLYSH
jgi:hypothetical protein